MRRMRTALVLQPCTDYIVESVADDTVNDTQMHSFIGSIFGLCECVCLGGREREREREREGHITLDIL